MRRSQVILRAGGKREVPLSISRWHNGDRLSIRCEHRNRTKRTVTWGENSADEMCIGFVYVSEL